MSAKVKLEAFVAQPPTSKCQQLIAALEEIVRRYPEQARLVVFERGAPWTETPSRVVRVMVHKGGTVPACAVDGQFVSVGEVPSVADLEVRLLRALGQQNAG
jgi:hypothetical protein